jgi:hypothetical protein
MVLSCAYAGKHPNTVIEKAIANFSASRFFVAILS